MPYVICRMVLNSQPTLRISKEAYGAVGPARAGLSEVIGVEEKFDALMENFAELEQTLMSIGIRGLAFNEHEYNHFLSLRTLIGRRIANLLSSARLYRDSLPHALKCILGAAHPAIPTLAASLSDDPKQPMSFRMIEAVRNYTQHQELPVSSISFGRAKETTKDGTRFSNTVVRMLDAIEVSKRRDLKPDVRASLAALGNSTNPMVLIREYLEHIGATHISFRLAINAIEGEWDNAISGLLDRYMKRYPKGGGELGLAVGFQKADRTITDPQHLVRDSLNYRKYLQSKNLTTVNLSKRYVKW